MKQSKVFIPTTKEVPADAEALSHKLMLRAGYIKQISAGAYAYLPLAWKVIRNIEQIVREEMEKIDSVEMMLPEFIPADLWKESGRYETYGPTLFKFKDRHDRDFILGPTHEETMTSIIKDQLNSYKKMPLTLYQIQEKFRDENRPRYGLLRGREFMMLDAYSFSADEEQLDASFKDMEKAFRNVFDRCGLDYRVIVGDAGAMGGSDSKEFSAMAAIGEDTIVYSEDSDYAANLEMATSIIEDTPQEEILELSEVATPDTKSITDVSKLLDVPMNKIIKAMTFIADENPVMVLIRGDYEVNDVKLKNFLNADELHEATEEDIQNKFGSKVGFIGPKDMDVKILGDLSIQNLVNGVIGANKIDAHYINANIDRDYRVDEFSDFRTIKEGELSPDNKGKLKFTRGIEIGHIFKLGTKYSKSLNANFLDKNGRAQPVIVGSYGIGISRLLSAICEQQSDEKGLIWNKNLTPFDVHVVPVNVKKADQVELADEITASLENLGMSVLVDDRNERPGVKFAESELIGIPLRITVGKRANEGIVEIKIRKTGETIEISKDEVTSKVQSLFITEIK